MTTPTNIRDPDIPVTLGAFRALQDEVRRLDALVAELQNQLAETQEQLESADWAARGDHA